MSGRLANIGGPGFTSFRSRVRDIAETIKERVGAKGVFVRSRAVHLCVRSRGPSDHTMETVCTYALGSFKDIDRQAELCQLLAAQQSRR